MRFTDTEIATIIVIAALLGLLIGNGLVDQAKCWDSPVPCGCPTAEGCIDGTEIERAK